MYVCKQIGIEARGPPFRANTVEFQATYIMNWAITERAARFDQVYHLRHDIRAWLINRYRSCVTERVQREVLHAFSSAKALLGYLVRAPPSDRNVLSSGQDWYIVASTFHDCVVYLLQQMSNEPTFQDTAHEALLAWNAELNLPAAYLYEIVVPSRRAALGYT